MNKHDCNHRCVVSGYICDEMEIIPNSEYYYCAYELQGDKGESYIRQFPEDLQSFLKEQRASLLSHTA